MGEDGKEVEWDYGLDIQKLSGTEDDVMYVVGEASNGMKDNDGENMDMDSLKAAFDTYMKNPVIRFMHDKTPQWKGAIGKVVEKYVDSAGKEHVTSFGSTPVLVAKFIKGSMPEWMWTGIKENIYKGFSIGGKAAKKVNGRVYVKSWLETSVVDVPSASGAFFTVLKAACIGPNCPCPSKPNLDILKHTTILDSILKGGIGSGKKGHRGKMPDVSQSPIVIAMREHEKKVKALTGEKQRMGNSVTRALYEEKSLKAGKWLSIKEFESSIGIEKGGAGSGKKGHTTARDTEKKYQNMKIEDVRKRLGKHLMPGEIQELEAKHGEKAMRAKLQVCEVGGPVRVQKFIDVLDLFLKKTC